jgi:hypothetical protein
MLPLGSPSNAYDQSLVEAFRQGLHQVGLVENKDIVLDVVWTGCDPDQAVAQLIERGAVVLPKRPSLDHLVGTQHERWRHFEADRLRICNQAHTDAPSNKLSFILELCGSSVVNHSRHVE